MFSHCFPQFSSVQFSLSVVSDSLRPHELQHARETGRNQPGKQLWKVFPAKKQYVQNPED